MGCSNCFGCVEIHTAPLHAESASLLVPARGSACGLTCRVCMQVVVAVVRAQQLALGVGVCAGCREAGSHSSVQYCVVHWHESIGTHRPAHNI